MAKRQIIPPETKAEAKRLFEAGCTSYLVAKRCGLNYKTVENWARTEAWEQTIVEPLPAAHLDGAMAAMSGMLTEAAYDEQLRKVALSVPFLISRLSVADVVAKADKVAKLIEMSREVLGKVDKGRGNPVISVGILSAGGLPRRASHVELIDNERVADAAAE